MALPKCLALRRSFHEAFPYPERPAPVLRCRLGAYGSALLHRRRRRPHDGGGSIICPGSSYRYTFGYELHCAREGQPISGPNNLEVNFNTGEHFHLTSLTRGFCTGPDASTPNAPFNTFYGTGAGVDIAAFTIQTAAGNLLQCSNTLEGGNNQAHRATGNKP